MSDLYSESIAEAIAGASPAVATQWLDALPVAVYLCDTDGRITAFNRRAEQLWGRAPRLNHDAERYCGSTRLFTVDGRPIAHRDCWMARAIRENARFQELEAVVERADGSRRVVLAHASPLCDAAGRVVGGINVMIDVTEKHRADEALRESERRLQVALSAASLGVWQWEHRTKRITWSPECLAMTGLASHDATRDDLLALVHPDDRDALIADARAAIAERRKMHKEFRIRHHDGGERWLVNHGQVDYDQAGNTTRIIGTLKDITASKRGEEMLRAKRAHLIASQRVAQVGSWEFEIVEGEAPPTHPLHWTDETYRIFGYEPGAVPATLATFRARVHPEDRQRVQELFRRASRLGAVYESEHRIVLDDGFVRLIRERAELLHDPKSGLPQKYIGTSQDVTERRRIESGVLARKRILKQIATGAPLTEVLERITRFMETQLPGSLCSILTLDAERRLRFGAGSTVPREYSAAIDGVAIGPRVGSCGTASFFRETVISADIDEDPLWRDYLPLTRRFGLRSCWSVPIFSGELDHTGRRVVLGTFGVYHRRPATPSPQQLQIVLGAAHLAGIAIERLRSEEALRRSELRSRAILNAIPDMMFRTDGDGRIFDFHSATEAPLLPPEQFLGRLVRDVLPPPTAELVERHRVEALATRQLQTFEYELDVPGVGICSYEARMVPCADQETVTIVREVTDRKRLEENLRRAQKLEALGRLAGGVAHDFNNLLTVVNGYSELLLANRGAEHPDFDALSAVRDAGKRAAALVKQLLAFSRGQPMQPTVVQVNEILEQMHLFARRMLSSDVELILDCAADLSPILADRTQIEHVVLNLIVNARDALPTGGRITLQTRNVILTAVGDGRFPSLRPGRYVQLVIADDGCGMAPDVQQRIFEPFFTTKEVGRGTGLGLPMVHGIVKQSGGQIDVDSEFGDGTTFTILLPAQG